MDHLYAEYMYKLFAAAHAIEFSVGCQAKCSSLIVKSSEFSLASTPWFSAPVADQCKNRESYMRAVFF